MVKQYKDQHCTNATSQGQITNPFKSGLGIDKQHVLW